ncbi:DUF2628 domain-containing protein [Zavarzinia compransoris]|uniref:DUF2628 domain-containing protein n=1 Tax=Zavarzinia marina TaxID=2911065 RepID=UPI001F2830E2|nr:DUF2628 domain-containing protein [Zavarzinia marina]MCF4167516.1 DUF2628 domain-containing protein [Zavarzinia marina]
MRAVAYTVHPGNSGAELVAERFSFTAFLFTPVWLLAHGAFLALGIWAGVVMAGIAGAIFLLPGSPLPLFVYLGASLYVGLEAGEVRRRLLARAGRPAVKVVMAETLGEAEDRVVLGARS